MTALLEKAFERASALPNQEQEAIGALISKRFPIFTLMMPCMTAHIRKSRRSILDFGGLSRASRTQGEMKFQVILPKSVQKEMDRLPDEITNRILTRLSALETNPRPPDVKKLKGRDAVADSRG